MDKNRSFLQSTLIYISILIAYILMFEGLTHLSRSFYVNGQGIKEIAQLIGSIRSVLTFMFHIGYGVAAYFLCKKRAVYPLLLQAAAMYAYQITAQYIHLFEYYLNHADKSPNMPIIISAIKGINPLSVPLYFLLAYIGLGFCRTLRVLRRLKASEAKLDLPPVTLGKQLGLIGVCLGGIALYILLFLLNLTSLAFVFTLIYYIVFAVIYKKIALKICGRLFESTVTFIIGGIFVIIFMLVLGEVVASGADLAGAAIMLMFIGLAIVILIAVGISVKSASKYCKSLEIAEAIEQNEPQPEQSELTEPNTKKAQDKGFSPPVMSVFFVGLICVLSVISAEVMPLINKYCYDIVMYLYQAAIYLVYAAVSVFYGVYCYRKTGKIIKPCVTLLLSVFVYCLFVSWGEVFLFEFYSFNSIGYGFLDAIQSTVFYLGDVLIAAFAAYVCKRKTVKLKEMTESENEQ